MDISWRLAPPQFAPQPPRCKAARVHITVKASRLVPLLLFGRKRLRFWGLLQPLAGATVRILDSLFRPALAAAAMLVAATLPAAAQPQPGQKFGDWTAGCEQIEGGQMCNISQSMRNEESKQTLLVAIARPPQGDPQILIRLPLGVILTEGVGIKVDDGPGARIPFIQCLPNGCQTIVPMQADTITRMKSGNTLNLSFVAPGGGVITAPMSLKGFTAGFDSLK
jgi:invasion protein IalB